MFDGEPVSRHSPHPPAVYANKTRAWRTEICAGTSRWRLRAARIFSLGRSLEKRRSQDPTGLCRTAKDREFNDVPPLYDEILVPRHSRSVPLHHTYHAFQRVGTNFGVCLRLVCPKYQGMNKISLPIDPSKRNQPFREKNVRRRRLLKLPLYFNAELRKSRVSPLAIDSIREPLRQIIFAFCWIVSCVEFSHK